MISAAMIKILYENKNIAVVVKPAGISSQPDMTGGEDMTALLSKQLNCEIYPVHRLDKVTGGVMIYAKNKKAAAQYSSSGENGAVSKIYFAAIAGKPENASGKEENYLVFNKAAGKSHIYDTPVAGAKKAALEYTVAETVCRDKEEYSLLLVRLITGRTHQIRAQLSHAGYPILGDGKYGSMVKCPLALWSYEAKAEINGRSVSFREYPPDIFPWDIFESINKKEIKK